MDRFAELLISVYILPTIEILYTSCDSRLSLQIAVLDSISDQLTITLALLTQLQSRAEFTNGERKITIN